jgi:hypothetical protein
MGTVRGCMLLCIRLGMSEWRWENTKDVEGSKDACAFRGELLGLLAIHLVLLAVTKLRPELSGQVRIVSDCLGALGGVVGLLTGRLPSGLKHSNILKILMVHCQSFSFECIYEHVEAHQDEEKGYHKLVKPSSIVAWIWTSRVSYNGV